jgi:hypothetical protein
MTGPLFSKRFENNKARFENPEVSGIKPDAKVANFFAAMQEASYRMGILEDMRFHRCFAPISALQNRRQPFELTREDRKQ